MFALSFSRLSKRLAPISCPMFCVNIFTIYQKISQNSIPTVRYSFSISLLLYLDRILTFIMSSTLINQVSKRICCDKKSISLWYLFGLKVYKTFLKGGHSLGVMDFLVLIILVHLSTKFFSDVLSIIHHFTQPQTVYLQAIYAWFHWDLLQINKCYFKKLGRLLDQQRKQADFCYVKQQLWS